MAQRTIVEWTGTFKMDEGLGFFTFADIIDHEGNIYSGPLTFDQAYIVPGFDIENTTAVTEINFPNLIRVGPGQYKLSANTALSSLSQPVLSSVTSDCHVGGPSALTTISFPALTSVTGSFSLDELQNLLTVNIPSLATVSVAFGCTNTHGSLASLSAPALTSVGVGIDLHLNSSLTTIDFPSLIDSGSFFDAHDCALSASTVNALLNQFVSGFASLLDINLSGGTSSAPTGQGILDKATLAARPGMTIATN